MPTIVLPSLFRVVVPVADGGDVSATPTGVTDVCIAPTGGICVAPTGGDGRAVPTGVADVCIAPTGGICVAPTGGDGRAVPTVVHPSSFRVVVPVAVSGSAVVIVRGSAVV